MDIDDTSFAPRTKIGDTIKLLQKFYNLFFLFKSQLNFVKHNKTVFTFKTKKTDNIILLEQGEAASNIIAYSYLASTLQDIHDAKIVTYFPRVPRSQLRKFLWWFKSKNIYYTNKLFTSFGSDFFLIPTINRPLKKKCDLIYQEQIIKIKNKADIENITIDGIVFGDLIYDYYLNYYQEITVDINSDNFKKHIKYCIKCVVFWLDFFENNTVKAINTSHTVYTNAIPIRISVHHGIDSFQLHATHVYRLTKGNFFAYKEFLNYKTEFFKLSKIQQSAGIEEARKRIDMRFSGEVGVDMNYSKKSAFGDSFDYRLIRESDKIKILVAPHCFYDSPHPFGINLYPDVSDWLENLIEISKKTDYDWYVKTHPDFLDSTKEMVEKVFKDHPKFTILPSDSSHLQIVDEGIDFALTMYGSIGFEYAAMNIPVINASLNNPHIAFDFNIHPKTQKEYMNILMDLKAVNHKINKTDVYRYYYMNKLHLSLEWLFLDRTKVLTDLGGYHGQFRPEMYQYWVENWTIENHQTILSGLRNFIDSGEYLYYPD
ncbi:hypothetical protein HOI27_04335 [bacterium]|nr:hypothetical protein [bacterium]